MEKRTTHTQLASADIAQAAQVLAEEGVVVYPTDTVYGLGADATSAAAVARVRAIKSRDDTKPILVTVSDEDMLARYAVVTPLAKALMAAFLPGPLTLVLAQRGNALTAVARDDGSVGFRLPASTVCVELVRRFGRPITSTSVNRSGMPQPRALTDMLTQVGEHVNDIGLVLDGGLLPVSAPSTVVDARGVRAELVREGAVSRTSLLRFF